MQNLAIFLSLGGSLTKWHREGIVSRELRHIERYIELGVFRRVFIFSYNSDDQKIIDEVIKDDLVKASIILLTPTGRFFARNRIAYSLLGPFIHVVSLKTAVVMKTNQISGAWAALVASILTRRRLVTRLGYVLSRRYQLNGQRIAAIASRGIEFIQFRFSDAIVVTSKAAEVHAVALSRDASKVVVIPTYVDTSLFVRDAPYDFDSPLLYVGRLTPQKNLVSLLKAAAIAGFEIHVVGDGQQRDELIALSREFNVQVKFLGHLSNAEVAEMMGTYTFFVLPSLHEGLPKVLIEAMSAGMICVGTDIPGINDLISDGENGYLASTVRTEDIASVLVRARREKNINVGANARSTITSRMGVDNYVLREKEVLVPPLDREVQ